MIDARTKLPAGLTARDFPLMPRSTGCDVESPTAVEARRIASRADARLRRIAAEIVSSVQARLPGRVRDLKVRIESGQFVLSGVSSTYYVKQVAQHLAMNALDAVMLGRVVNEIEVRAAR